MLFLNSRLFSYKPEGHGPRAFLPIGVLKSWTWRLSVMGDFRYFMFCWLNEEKRTVWKKRFKLQWYAFINFCAQALQVDGKNQANRAVSAALRQFGAATIWYSDKDITDVDQEQCGRQNTALRSELQIAPMGSPSHSRGVSRLSLPTPFSPIFVCPSAYQNLSSVLLFTHQLLPTYLQFSSSDRPFCLHRPFTYISLLYKPSFCHFSFSLWSTRDPARWPCAAP